MGATAILALMIGIRRHSVHHHKSMEEWTATEEAKFAETFQTTHDFEKLCQIVPNRSRESVAYRAKLLLDSESNQRFGTFLRPPQRYAFVSERRKQQISQISSKISSFYQSFRPQNSTATSSQVGDSVSMIAHSRHRFDSRNPAFQIDSARSPEPSY